MKAPPVRFATTTDGVRIAYTVWGEGPAYVLAPPIVSNVEMQWEHDQFRQVFDRMGRHVTVFAFDKRGIGMSDRFDEAPDNEHRIADFLAVMDAEGIDTAHVSGISEGGTIAQILAVTHPERVDHLVISNAVAPRNVRERVHELAVGPVFEGQEFVDRWGHRSANDYELKEPRFAEDLQGAVRFSAGFAAIPWEAQGADELGFTQLKELAKDRAIRWLAPLRSFLRS